MLLKSAENRKMAQSLFEMFYCSDTLSFGGGRGEATADEQILNSKWYYFFNKKSGQAVNMTNANLKNRS